MPIVDATSAIDLPSYGDALVSSCESFVETAVRDVDVDDVHTAAGPATDAHVDAMTTRACVDACARLDAEATKGTARQTSRSSLATTRTVTDDGCTHAFIHFAQSACFSGTPPPRTPSTARAREGCSRRYATRTRR